MEIRNKINGERRDIRKQIKSMNKFSAKIGASIHHEIEDHFKLQVHRIELKHDLKVQKLQRRNKRIQSQHRNLKEQHEDRLAEIKTLKQRINGMNKVNRSKSSTQKSKMSDSQSQNTVQKSTASSRSRFGDKSRRRTLSPHYAKESDLNKLVVTLDNNKNEMQCQIQSLCDKFEQILVQKQKEQHRDRHAVTPRSSRSTPRRRRRIFSESDLSIRTISEHQTNTFESNEVERNQHNLQSQRIPKLSNQVLIQQKSKCDQLRSEMVDLQNVVTQWRDRSDLDFRHILFAFSSFLKWRHNERPLKLSVSDSWKWKESMERVLRKCWDLKVEHNNIRSIFQRNVQRVDGEFVDFTRKFMEKMKRNKAFKMTNPVMIPTVKRLVIPWSDSLSAIKAQCTSLRTEHGDIRLLIHQNMRIIGGEMDYLDKMVRTLVSKNILDSKSKLQNHSLNLPPNQATFRGEIISKQHEIRSMRNQINGIRHEMAMSATSMQMEMDNVTTILNAVFAEQTLTANNHELEIRQLRYSLRVAQRFNDRANESLHDGQRYKHRQKEKVLTVNSQCGVLRESYSKMTVFITKFVHLHHVEMQHVEGLIVHRLEQEMARKTKRKLKIKWLKQSVKTLTVRNLLDHAQKGNGLKAAKDGMVSMDNEELNRLQSQIGGLLKGLNESMETVFGVMENMKRKSQCNINESDRFFQHFNFKEDDVKQDEDQDGNEMEDQGRVRKRYLKLLERNMKQRRRYSDDLESAISGSKQQHRVLKMKMGQMESMLSDLQRRPFRC